VEVGAALPLGTTDEQEVLVVVAVVGVVVIVQVEQEHQIRVMLVVVEQTTHRVVLQAAVEVVLGL
jgi:hypothetical protein